jgi:hypothetical protein
MIAAIVAASAAFCIECFCLYQFANSKTCSHGSHNGDQGKAHYSGDIAALIDIELQRLAGKPAQQPTIYCGLLTLVAFRLSASADCEARSQLLAVERAVLMVVNVFVSCVPTAVIVAMITTEMSAAMSPYSMAVAPLSSRTKEARTSSACGIFDVGDFIAGSLCDIVGYAELCITPIACP